MCTGIVRTYLLPQLLSLMLFRCHGGGGLGWHRLLLWPMGGLSKTVAGEVGCGRNLQMDQVNWNFHATITARR